VELSVEAPKSERIVDRLDDIEKRRDELLELQENLQALYKEKKETANEASIEEEADGIVDRVDSETRGARLFLAKGVAKSSEGNSNAQSKGGNLDNSSAKDSHVADPNKQLERIRIPKFSGDKMKYSSWWAAFSSCVDETSLSPQFKMLRLESCLEGEAAATVKGLGYSSAAYEAAKTRLSRKYGGNRRQVQAHIDEMKPFNAEHPRELEKFADLVERTVVTLKENKHTSDLYAIVLEKILQSLLSQYYKWVKEKGKLESLEELREWVPEEAEYQVQASEVKNGVSSAGGRHVKWPRSTGDKRDPPCKVCNQKHLIWCEVLKRMENKKRWETTKKLGLCYRCLGKGHLGEECRWSKECGIDGCKEHHHQILHPKKNLPDFTEGNPDPSNVNGNKSSTYGTVKEHEQICSALKISTHEVTYWVDSVNVGYWIRSQSREYKPFVAHRVGEIHECSAPYQWRYVPTKVNPADHGTRGLTVKELADTSQWWNGPEFLKRSEEEWPECKFDAPTSEESLELKRGKEVSAKETCSYEITRGGEKNPGGHNAREEGVWRLNPSRYGIGLNRKENWNLACLSEE